MRLKQLDLQGYKTFATKTEFLFKGGLTAIIGPNGSGKSNVADAIQWVLGEQSYSRLRAKRSEDMIFSGSNERARLGMAQASLTLDNSDGWLPVDFGEVVVTRRSYRSGENEYYLNGTRVRLRDITELLSQSGLAKRTYTVVGQGLIDQALSLRPDERRTLIEEAAGITGYQAKRDTALRQLDETRHNLERAHDILSEIEPRLRYLKSQARRAEERLQIQADLDTQLRIWYGYRWHRSLQELQAARQEEAQAGQVVQARQEVLERLDGQELDLRQRHTVLRNQLGDWHRESSTLHRQAEAAQRELAVGSERLRQLGERRDDLQRELGPLEQRQDAQGRQVEMAEAALAEEVASLREVEERIEALQSQRDALEAQRRTHQKARASAHHRVAELQQEMVLQERRLVGQQGRKRALAEEGERLEAELATAQAGQVALAAQIDERAAQVAQLEQQGRAMVERREVLLAAIAQTEAELAGREEERARLRRQADRLQDQLDLMQRLKEEGEGYSGGARSIIRAMGSGSGDLSGIVGTVADQLQVPAELELAIETALGGRLQDVIVERWDDAEQAIDWLKRTRGGRATFLPVDTLRPGQPIRAPSGPGIVGLAADLVQADGRLSTVVDYLLGRVVVTVDLPTARRVLDATRERPTVVTLEGDIVRPGGSVSGGSQAVRRDQGVLARERALRELPQQLAEAEGALAHLADEQKRVRRTLEEQRGQVEAVNADLAEAGRRQQQESAALAKLQGQASQIGRELAWRQERMAAAEKERAAMDEDAVSAQERLAELAEAIEQAQEAVAAADREMEALDTGVLTADLMERRTAASVHRARVASQETIVANQQRALAQLRQEARHKQQRIQELGNELEALEARLQEMRAAEAGLSSQIEAYAQRIDPAEAELAALEVERNALAGHEAELRRHLQQEEQAHNRTQLALQRAHDELEHLRNEIEHDVGLVELEQSDDLADQPPLPLRPLVERLPQVDALPETTEQEIRHLRAQYSRLGSVNPNAPQEYADALERFEFLTSQSADLEEAEATLQSVVKELNEVMQREFMSTFRAVAREFKERFTALFGGGTARLELSEPDDPMHSGIEIVARPPGKRTMALPLLSGGERSLTAAALILSILKVSPPPFCILDEVDAALDEANVDRFRAALQEAAQDIQFIVITHNRGTIEVADTIYGISMGSDSTSQALSLHMEEFDGQRQFVPDS